MKSNVVTFSPRTAPTPKEPAKQPIHREQGLGVGMLSDKGSRTLRPARFRKLGRYVYIQIGQNQVSVSFENLSRQMNRRPRGPYRTVHLNGVQIQFDETDLRRFIEQNTITD